MKELISVIINVYNCEKYIEKCLDSVINQTYKNLEILIINDGSTDNTLNIIKEFKDKRIKIITTKNQGLAMSRNKGIENAKGEYLYFVDADDYIENDTIEYLYNLIKKYNTLISTCRCMDIYDYNFKVPTVIEDTKLLDSKDFLKETLLYKNRTMSTWNKLYKKEIFDNLRFEKRIVNDLAFTHKLLIKAEKIAYSNKTKYFYLRHNDAITSKNKDDYERNIDIYLASIERHKYIENCYPSFIENDVSVLLTIIMVYLRSNGKMKKYLKDNNALKIYKKLFSFKLFKCNIKFREKIKLLLFRISPLLYESIIKTYLFIKNIF